MKKAGIVIALLVATTGGALAQSANVNRLIVAREMLLTCLAEANSHIAGMEDRDAARARACMRIFNEMTK
jgi:hypothetical protein